MRAAVIGSGIAGLCSATELLKRGVEVEVFERDDQFGGRASVVGGVEHCSRIMMNDYTSLRSILDRVPAGGPGTSIWQSTVPVHRMVHLSNRGWVELDHIYGLRTKEVSIRERFELARHRSRKPLIASEFRPSRLEVMKMASQMSLRGWARIAAASWKVDGARSFRGATDTHLIDPWVTYLSARGVNMTRNREVDRVRSGSKPRIRVENQWREFDLVVVATFLPDLVRLFDASGLSHGLVLRKAQMHACASATFVVDEHEPLVTRHPDDERCYLYAGGGFYALYQPSGRRVVTVSTRPGPRSDHILEATRRMLKLESPVELVGLRENDDMSHRLFGATPIEQPQLGRHDGIAFAGSFLSSGYPLDSGESSARSALAAIDGALPETAI